MKFFSRFFTLLTTLLLFLAQPAFSENYTFIKIIDSDSTQLPNSKINAYNCAPAIEGDYVVFRTAQVNSGLYNGIWAWKISTQTFMKLADLSDQVPGGTGTFKNFGIFGSSLGGPALKDGIVVFGGTDQGTNPNSADAYGIYSVPVTGGQISKIANYNTAVPAEPTNFFNFGEDSRNYGSVSTANNTVVFEGTFGGGPIGGTGLYTSSAQGGGVNFLADSNDPWNPTSFSPVMNFYNPATNGSGVAMIGGTVFGNYGVFYTPLPSNGGPSFSLLVDPDTALPGSTSPSGDTKLINPSIQLSGNTVGFIAYDVSSDTLGIYSIPTSGGAISKIVDTKTSLEGISFFPSAGVNPFSYDIDGEEALFSYYANQDNQGIYHRATNGQITRVVDGSFSIDGIAAYTLGEVTPYSHDDGRFVFSYGTLGFPRDVLVLAIPQTGSNPTDTPNFGAEFQALVNQALGLISTAKKKLPKGKSQNATSKKIEIKAAQTQLKSLMNQILELFQNESSSVLLVSSNVNEKKIKNARKAVKKGSKNNAKASVRKKQWKSAKKLLASF